MPNIEIVGYSQPAFEILKFRIDQVMQGLNLGGDAVTTYLPVLVESCDGKLKKMPYLRVCSTKPGQTVEIVNAFKQAEIQEDCEELLLTGFTPATEMVASPSHRPEQDGPDFD